MTSSNIRYFRRRAREERAAASKASHERVARIHSFLAARYASEIASEKEGLDPSGPGPQDSIHPSGQVRTKS